MSDIVERLRIWAAHDMYGNKRALEDAAAEIARLRAENELLREENLAYHAAHRDAQLKRSYIHNISVWAVEEASTALKKNGDE